MRDWLTIQVVLGWLLLTSSTCVGLLAMWAARSRWHWFIRTVIVIGVLSPLLLRPMYEPLVTFAVQIIVTVSAVRIAARRAVLWDIMRRRHKVLLPRFSMHFVLAATCLAAIVSAVAVAAIKHLGPTFWIAPASLGVVVGLTTLIAAWLACVGWSWKSLLILLVSLVALSYAYQETDYVRDIEPVVNFWPHSWPPSVLPMVVSYLRALVHITMITALQYAFLLGWYRWISRTRDSRRFLEVSRLPVIAAMLVLVAFPVYVVLKMQFPSEIPKTASFPGEEDRFQQLLTLSDSFKRTPLWRELCANQVNKRRVATAVKNQSSEFDELHRLLEQPLLRPVTVDWIANSATHAQPSGWRKTMEENRQLSVLAQVLDARSEAARSDGDVAAAVESALDLLRVAESTSRAVDFSTHLRADAFEGMAIACIYRLLPLLNESQCGAVVRRLVEMETHREPIAKLLRYHRAQSENEYGWMGHVTAVLGDIANRLDPSLDANHVRLLRNLDRRSQALARLLIVELQLRQHFLHTGEYPRALEGLAGMSMSEWFADPFAMNRETFVYRRQDGKYLLYSFGVDRDDDRGRPLGKTEYGYSDWRSDGDLRLEDYFASGIGE